MVRLTEPSSSTTLRKSVRSSQVNLKRYSSYPPAVEHGRNGAGAEVLLAISREFGRSLDSSQGADADAASGRLSPTGISSRFGKTLTLIFPSSSLPRQNMRSSISPEATKPYRTIPAQHPHPRYLGLSGLRELRNSVTLAQLPAMVSLLAR